MKRIRILARRLLRSQAGVAAVEFSLIAPILCIACVTTADLGMALTERMTIDHVLRAGAESAMKDSGEDDVVDVMDEIASNNFDNSGGGGDDDDDDDGGGAGGGSSSGTDSVTLDATRFCACPDAPDSAVDCSTTCTDSAPTYVYYRLSAAKTYPGMIIPDIDFDVSLQVQTR